MAGFAPSAAPTPVDPARLARAARAIETAKQGAPCTQARDLALLRAVGGDLAGAVALLRPAAAMADPWCAVELSAWLIELGDRTSDPDLLLDALEAARLAAASGAGSLADFNRALALELLGLRDAAREAWSRLEGREPEAAWAEVARRHAADLAAPSPAERARPLLMALLADTAPPDDVALDFLSRELPQSARQTGCDELLPAAARAALRGDLRRARQQADLAAELGRRLVERGGDATLARAALEAHRALDSTPAAGEDWLRGVEAYGRARGQVESELYVEAGESFAQAARWLARASSVLAPWSELGATHADSFGRPASQARAELVALERRTRDDSPALAARLAWAIGVEADREGDLPLALARFDQAVAGFDRLGEGENAAAARALRAWVLDDLGRASEAGRDLLDASRSRARVLSPLREQLIVDSFAALRAEPRGAGILDLFHAELIAIAQRDGRPGPLAQAFLVRSQNRARDAVERAMDAATASRWAALIVDARERARKNALIDTSRAEILLESEPEAALRAIDAALGYLTSVDLEPLRLPALALRARALRGGGHRVEAEAQLLAAIAATRRVRDRARSYEERSRTLQTGLGLFEELASLRLREFADPDGALSAIELGRAETLLAAARRDRPSLADTDRAEPATSDFARALPPGFEVLEYARFEDELVAWHLRRDGSSFHRLAGSAAQTLELARRLVAAFATGSPEARSLASRLGESLIPPLAPPPGADSTLVVVAPSELAAIPWPALVDPASGSPLIESRSVLLAPSIRLFRTLNQGQRWVRPRSVRALGEPMAATSLAPRLARLPGSGLEAREVAAVYPRAELLLAEAATVAAASRSPLPDVLHLSSHALGSPGAPQRAALVLAPDPTTPSGLWTASSILDSRFEGVLVVVLAGCATAANDSTDRGESVSLATAFLAAGVPSVVATLWPVEDDRTRDLMRRFHIALEQGREPRFALREAQLQLASGDAAGSLGAWASFVLLGAR